MAAIDKHGLKMVGLKKASGATEDYGYYSGKYNEIFYNRSTGEVWTVFQSSLGQNTWTEYHDPDILKVVNASDHYTMQEIADIIYDAVCEDDRAKQEEARYLNPQE